MAVLFERGPLMSKGGMLVFEAVQMQAVESTARRLFARNMVAHLACFSRPLIKAVGEEQMHRVVEFGVVRAALHGFTQQGPVRLYLELMLLFGSHFDTDPQYAWAGAALAYLPSSPQMQRAERLYHLTLQYREQVTGADDVHALAALRQVAALAHVPLPPHWADADLCASLERQVRHVYPRKARYVGDEALTQLVRKSIAGAEHQQFPLPRGAVLVLLLMLGFGHGCGADPLYPWIERTLTDERIGTPEARAARLEKRALTWLSHVLAHFDAVAVS